MGMVNKLLKISMIWLKGIRMNFANDEEETPITNNEWFSIFGDETLILS